MTSGRSYVVLSACSWRLQEPESPASDGVDMDLTVE